MTLWTCLLIAGLMWLGYHLFRKPMDPPDAA